MEEELAMYRNFAKPSALLHVSYSASDSSGKVLNPSHVFERLRRIFPGVPVERDIRNARTDGTDDDETDLRLIQHPDQTLDYLSGNLRKHAVGEDLSAAWKGVAAWYGENRPEDVARVKAGLLFRGRRERVNATFVDGLYRKVTSPSALEKYSRCPFSWFMSHGLRLRERREADMDSMSMGTVYHNVLMRFGRELSSDGLSALDSESRWRTVTDDEIGETITRLTEEEYRAAAEPWSAGAGGQDEADASMDEYRIERMSRTAALTARALTRHVRESRVEKMLFETSFGKDGDFPPVAARTARSGAGAPGEDMRVEGRIDRVDIMEGGYARVIDYKSGTVEFSPQDAETGYQMQLMVYMNAVAKRYDPAGVFYLHIKEPHVADNGDDAGNDASVMNEIKLDGVAVDDARVLVAMGMDPDGKASKSKMEPADFAALSETVDATIKDLLTNMSSGRIDATPKESITNENKSACDYCSYKGVCNHDASFAW
jgi:ATP-dependent helicase/nuclease subunit B